MPIYEYACRDCGHRFEYLVLPTSPAAACPACSKKDLEQQISLSAMSSESSRDANYSSANKKASAARKDQQETDHQHLHEHFD